MAFKENHARYVQARLGVFIYWAGSLSFIAVLGVMLFGAFVLGNTRMLEQADGYEVLINLITALCRISGGILFLLWMRRAYYNLSALGANTEYSDGWAVGAWFIPLLNLVRPYQIMRELIRKSEKMLAEEEVQKALRFKAGEELQIPRLSNKVLVFWWGAWIAITVVDRIFAGLIESMTDGSDYFIFLVFVLVFILVVSASALLLLKIMKHQHRLSQLLIQAKQAREEE